MITILERPNEIMFSRSPFRYRLQTDTDNSTAGLLIELQLYYRGINDSAYVKLIDQPAYPDSEGNVFFYPGSVLDAMLIYSLPVLADNNPQILPGQVGQYYIMYREVTAITPTPDWMSDALNAKYVVKGGLSYERGFGPNYFSYLETNKAYLTWLQSGRLIGQQEVSYLCCLMIRTPVPPISVDIKISLTDGTEATPLNHPLVDVEKYHVICIPSGMQQLGIIAPNGKMVYYYEISVTDAEGCLAAPFRFMVDYRNNYNETQFCYHNSLGGFDSIRVLGEITAEIQKQMETSTITTGLDTDPNQVTPMEFVAAIRNKVQYKGNAGFRGKDEQHCLTDLYYSASVWQPKYDRWWPVILTAQNIQQPSSTDNLFSVPIEWRHGWSNNSFTPEFKTI